MFDAILLDMDGVLFHGERPLPRADEFLQKIRRMPHLFITNNPTLAPDQVVAKFVRIGLPKPEPEQILTSAQATADWLAKQKPGFGYYAVGAVGLHQALCEVGLEDPLHADFVVVGEGPGLDFATLTRGINLIVKQGARLVATNPDINVDASVEGVHCLVPGGGALVAPFAVASGVEPVIIGKPNPLMFDMAMRRLGCQPEHCLMVGDRPDTDIAGAAALGMRTALVRTGRFLPGDTWPEGLVKPDWDVENLQHLRHFIQL
ncbi:MAG: HAD-IIA family hydrolase [Gammaproteobacteria bacterium]|nr:HAD-IIA family hydrolase [Gammaproteobacteria bacterium]